MLQKKCLNGKRNYRESKEYKCECQYSPEFVATMGTKSNMLAFERYRTLKF